MKLLFSILAAGSLSLCSAQTSTNVTINVNGTARTYILYIPAIYNASTPVPLVFNFHGRGSNSSQQQVYGDFRPIADTANFIIAHPQGLVVAGSTGWNNFGFPADAQPDLDFTEAMITKISTDYNIDQNRIYSTGMSNGGFMSYDNACYLSHRFAAIASVTGGMSALHRNTCQASHPTPVMQIHGTADAVVDYYGAGTFSSLPVDSLVKFWRNFNQCNPTPAFTALPDIVTSDNCTAEHYVYSGGQRGSSVELYKIINGGHTWPGAIFPVNGNTNMDFSASKEIWRFFSKYKLNELTLSVHENAWESKVNVYPNPAIQTVTIEVEKFEGLTVEIVDATGKLVHSEPLKGFATEIRLKQGTGFYLYKLKQGDVVRKVGKISFV